MNIYTLKFALLFIATAVVSTNTWCAQESSSCGGTTQIEMNACAQTTYLYLTGDGNDTITDTDGSILYDNTTLSGGTKSPGQTVYRSSDGTYTYAWTGGDLTINPSAGSGQAITVKNFNNNDLGIHLDEQEDPAKPPKKPPYNPGSATWSGSCPLALDLNNNGRIDDVSLTNSTAYFDLTQDGIAEKSGWLTPADGLLALDINGNGVVDDRGELFGADGAYTGFDRLSQRVDLNGDGVVNTSDSLFSALRVWQDANSDGISQLSELKTLAELGITRISTAQTRVSQTTANGNKIIATGSYVRNGQQQYVADIEFAYDPALTDANPNRPLGLPPTLDGDVYQLPWLRGYGTVKSLHLAYQQDITLRQMASGLIAQGSTAILQNFEKFMAQWTGLVAAHQAKGVTRSNLTIEDKVWILESMIGQNVQKGAIEAASFGVINPGGLVWLTTYIEAQWQALVQQEAISFAIQATAKDWIKGAYYSLTRDRFVVTDAAMLQTSLVRGISTISDRQNALFAAVTLDRLRNDGCDLQAATLKTALATAPYAQAYEAAIDGRFTYLVVAGTFSVPDSRNWWVIGSSVSDTLRGNDGAGNDAMDGGGEDIIFGKGGDDFTVANRLYSAWVLSQSSNAASMRVCQPLPVARKVSTTLGESRMVMRSFVGASCAPRARPVSLLFSVLGNAEKDEALRASAAVHSGLSASTNSGLGLRFINIHLSFICLPKTNHPYAVTCFHKHQSMQSLIQPAQGTNAHLAIVSPLVWRKECRLEFKIPHPLKRQAAQFDVAGIFSSVKGNPHNLYCMYKIKKSQRLMGNDALNADESDDVIRAANDAVFELRRVG